MTNGPNDLTEVGDKLLREFTTNFMMVLEFANSLEGEEQELYLSKIEEATIKIDNFINDLDITDLQ